MKPHGFDAGKKYPLILNVHGGPQSQWADSFRGDWQVYPGKGYVVAFCNPAGSTGYGQAFTDAIAGDWGGRVYRDLMKVTDALVALPYVDAKRVGVMGWSYGGYMTMWMQGHTDRFQCIASMMGVYDLEAMYGSTEELWFPEHDLKGTPWTSSEYAKWSPSEFVKSFKTPALVITGEKDYRVPYTQSLEYYTALRKMERPGAARRVPGRRPLAVVVRDGVLLRRAPRLLPPVARRRAGAVERQGLREQPRVQEESAGACEVSAPDWTSLSDDELLEQRISQLGLKLEGTPLQPLIQQLYDELSQKGLLFHPPCHVGDEWFVPVGIPVIFIPFFLAHDRLRQLEKKIILEVEGETPEWFMKLIRHEAAHAYSYAYRFVQEAEVAAHVRQVVHRGDAVVLSAASVQPELRGASRRLVCAERIPTRISRRRSPCGSRPGSTGATRYRGLEGAAEARIRRRVDAIARRQAAAAHAGVSRRRLRLPQRQAQDLLRAEAEGVRAFVPGFLRQRSAAAVRRRRGCRGAA